jgi:ATP synthase protein I
MSTPPPPRDELLRNLTQRADALERGNVRPVEIGAGKGRAIDQAYKLIGELVGGVIVGLALGFGIDRVFHVAPWGLLGGVLVGFAVSVWMAKRTADRLMAQARREEAQNTGGDTPPN